MTRTVHVTELGGPEVLKIVDADPGAPGPGEVRIAVKAIGLNRVEAMFRSGGFGLPPLPSTIGYEAVGLVEAVGEGVSEWQAGDRVATIPGLPMEQYGVYGEAVLYPAAELVALPDDQPWDEAAATWMQYLTAYGLIGVGGLSAGDAVVINAASSSVGLAAIDVVKAQGGTSIAMTRGAAKADALKAHGADHVIISDEQDVAATIREITGGAGARLAFDAVGGAPLAALLAGMALRGVVLVYGTLAGDLAPIPMHLPMMGNLTIRGYAMNDMIADAPVRAAAFDYIRAGIADGSLRTVIDSRFALDEIVAAHQHLESNSQFGKIVVMVG